MGVPFEALLPYGIIICMFGITGAGMSKIRHMQNGGKRARHSIDQWDRVMMDRDRRLTGWLRGQTDSPTAPKGYELNNPWRVSKYDIQECRPTDQILVRKAYYLRSLTLFSSNKEARIRRRKI
ncbi:Bgt-3566 [Blumeria graminis f. sp. tritici]|uniref:NADH dehydrogenase [ubiquinone] 1 alpha subcomplex subunit 1 n=1 Tax=Blumeria graminis f. sp. tritici TaxID=62690 RepID=A0A9X9MKU5_BLUGR|nr:Bgt-3566 [Blumeria graminis f. sp. tritici]